MIDVVAGLDIGGSTLVLAVERLDGGPVEVRTEPALSWEIEPAADAADWIAGQLRRLVPDHCRVRALGVGAQGGNTLRLCAALTAALGRYGIDARVVNDAALLVPAAGLAEGIGLIAGTGAIAVGTDARGEPVSAGGWGWVLGDDGGGAGLVREATRAALADADAGRPDDGLLAALCAAFTVDTAERLARAVNDDPTPANWAPRAPVVFAAAAAGSARAAAVVEHAADHLSALVGQVRRRGAVGDAVVAAGGVLTAQPRLYRAVVDRLARQHPRLRPVLLTEPPVRGAIRLAHALLAAESAR